MLNVVRIDNTLFHHFLRVCGELYRAAVPELTNFDSDPLVPCVVG